MIVRRELLGSGMYKGLPTAERIIYMAMWLRCDGSRTCFPSLRKIAEDTGVGRTRVVTAIKRLCVLGIVRKQRHAGRPMHTVIYWLKDLERMYEAGGKKISEKGSGNGGA